MNEVKISIKEDETLVKEVNDQGETVCRIGGCIKMGKNKPRTAVNRRVNKLLVESPNECEWWDGGYPECMLPWSHKGCNGNPFVCRKFYYKYLASAAKPSQDIINEFDKRQMNNKDN